MKMYQKRTWRLMSMTVAAVMLLTALAGCSGKGYNVQIITIISST